MTGPIPDALFDAAAVARALLAWYSQQARPLPWRQDPSPYRVLVSEFMLQQTQVETVIPYFERFIERFPTLDALACASEDEVLKLWEGLGYYRRARNLHRLARYVCERRQGRLPDRVEELRELPGVGEYTAGAVASIAFGHPVPAVDGNVQRVLARLLNVGEPVDRAPGRARIAEAARRLVAAAPPGRAGDLNQALMELGSLVCTPREPACARCPVKDGCEGHRQGRAAALPARQAAARPLPVDVMAFVIVDRCTGANWAERVREGRVLLQRRPTGGLLGGLWGLPAVEESGGAGAGLGKARGGAEEGKKPVRGPAALLAEAGLEVGDLSPEPLCVLEHTFSHRRWRLRAYGVALLQGESPDRWWQRLAAWLKVEEGALRWADARERSLLGIPRPFRRVLERVEGPEEDGGGVTR